MAILTYNDGRIIPSPLPSISKQIIGDKIGVTYQITLNGTLVAHRGSPQSDGTFSDLDVTETTLENSNDKLKSIQRKQEAIRDLFKREGLVLQIQTDEGFTTLTCNPRNINIEFLGGEREVWVDKCNYVITCEADTVRGPGISSGQEDEDLLTTAYFLSEASETWQIEFKEYHFSGLNGYSSTLSVAPVYSVTHTVSATGKRSYVSSGTKTSAVDNARGWVGTRLGFNATAVTTNGSLSIPSSGYTAYNYRRNSGSDEVQGTYTVTETWDYTPTQSSTPVSFSLNMSYTFNTKSSPVLSGTMEGTIRGLDNSGGLATDITAFNNALNFYKNNIEDGFLIVKDISIYMVIIYLLGYPYKNTSYSYDLNALSKVVSENINEGIVTFSYEVDSSINPACVVPRALSQVVVVSDSLPGQIIAEIPILNRRLGPILQNMNTYTARKRTLSAEFVVPPSSTCSIASHLTYKPNINALVESIKPTGANIQTHSYKVSDIDTWDFFNGRYSRNVEWIYQEDCGV